MLIHAGLDNRWKGGKQCFIRVLVKFHSYDVSFLFSLRNLRNWWLNHHHVQSKVHCKSLPNGRWGSARGQQYFREKVAKPCPNRCYLQWSESLLTSLPYPRLSTALCKKVTLIDFFISKVRARAVNQCDEVYMSMTPTDGWDRKCEKFLN